MKTAALYTAGACCGAAVLGSTAFLSNSPPIDCGRQVWRSSQSRLRTAASRSRATRGSVCPTRTGWSVVGGPSLSMPNEVRQGGRAAWTAGSHQMTLLSNLDLKPAYRLFDTVPPPASMEGAKKACDINLDVNEKAPYGVDPFKMVSSDLSPFTETIKDLLDAEHPVLSMAAKHFFEKRHGKRFRPTVVTLMALATCKDPADEHRASMEYRKQGQLGQITEMIHVASLIHDDVLDEAEVRRGDAAVHKLYTNKVAVLAGDYLLARASVLLARLNNVQVVEIMATALDSLVQGEILQLKMEPEKLLDLSQYLRKSYYKTASLITNACKSCALLGGHDFDSDVATAAEEYGYHMGLAFQVVDDILDIVGVADTLGKPAMADMSLGLATAPLLYAAESAPEIRQVIKRRFKNEGDKELALKAVLAGDAVERSRELARWHAQRAVDAALRLPPSEARDGLVNVCHVVLTRNK